MKNKSLFLQIISVIVLSVSCLILTVAISLLVGSVKVDLFDFKNLNFSNMIPVLLIGGFISCVVVGICILFVGRAAWFKAKDYFKETNKEKGEKEK